MLFTHYRERLHLKKAAQGIIKTKKEDIDWRKKKLKAIGLLMDTSAMETKEVQQLLKTLEKRTNNLQILIFEPKEASSTNNTIFTKKETDWLFRPKGEKVTAFSAIHYDLLINLCQGNCYPLGYLAVSCKAKFKIGALTDYPNDYDLLLEADGLANYIHQIRFFLKKFRTQFATVAY